MTNECLLRLLKAADAFPGASLRPRLSRAVPPPRSSQVDPADPSHARVARACGADEKLWSVTFRTDAYGYETSWSLEAKASNDDWTLLAAGPPGRQKYRDNTVYRGATCLRGDVMYRLRIMDAYADGFCCSFGEGYYQYKVDGDLEYDTGRGVRTFKQAGEHLFYVGLPTPEYGSIESYFANQGTPFSGRSAGCDRGEQHFRIKITTDNFPGDNAWEFKSLDTGRVIDKAESRDVKQYGKNRAKEMAYCIPYGKYRFTITDSLGDGTSPLALCGLKLGRPPSQRSHPLLFLRHVL